MKSILEEDFKDLLGKQITTLSSELVFEFVGSFEYKELQKSHNLLKQGEVCSFVAFVKKGCLMCYYNKGEKRFIDEFTFEGGWISDYMSFVNESEADKGIKAIEDTDIWFISKAAMLKLESKYGTDVNTIKNAMAQYLYCRWYKKHKTLLINNPLERYTGLFDHESNFLQRVPQYLVAQYLGITEQSLSRLRKRVGLSR